LGGRLIVSDVDLEVRPGEVVGLLGPNGAGKTTTFRMLLGLLRPDRGAVRFGLPVDGLPLDARARLGLGYLPQGPSVLQGLSAQDNLLAVLEANHQKEPARKAKELILQFGLSDVASQRAARLSGGERRRLEFARALCISPSVLLCDEPLAGVDPIAAAEISRAVLALKHSGVGVLLTDHNVRGALALCDRVYLLAEGKIAVHGTPSEIRDSDVAKRVYLGEEPV
jgi:lipopolysaccharide export system ATP-binding protein